MMGMRVLDLVSLTGITKTLPPRFKQTETSNLARRTAPALPFADTAEIAFVDFNLTGQFGCLFKKVLDNHGTDLVLEKVHRIAVHADQ